jgi:LysR family glycine cleavage system transcriptional activator
MRCFEAAARRQSFTRAADELGMTQGAVSYQMKLLEERLGVLLFLRGPRGVALTEAGRRLAPAVTVAFARILAALDAIGYSAEGVLSLSATNTFALNWLARRLGIFQLAHPQITLRLHISGRPIDFTREEVDIEIRTGAGQWPGLAVHRLMEDEYTPMLSPRLLNKIGPLGRPADLLNVPLIDPADPWWKNWFAAAGVEAPDLSGQTEMRFGVQNLAAQSALAGQGVALLTPVFFSTELAEGRLVQPFPLVQSAGHSYWLVCLQARRDKPKIKAFRDWLLATIAADEASRLAAGHSVQTTSSL